MAFLRGLATGLIPTGQNIAAALMGARQRREEAKREESRNVFGVMGETDPMVLRAKMGLLSPAGQAQVEPLLTAQLQQQEAQQFQTQVEQAEKAGNVEHLSRLWQILVFGAPERMRKYGTYDLGVEPERISGAAEKAIGEEEIRARKEEETGWQTNFETGQQINQRTGEVRDIAGFKTKKEIPRWTPYPDHPGFFYSSGPSGPEIKHIKDLPMIGKADPIIDSLVEVVREDPNALDRLSADQRGQVLARLGVRFKVPRPISDVAISKINDFDQSISYLQDLLQKFETSKAARGPISGTLAGMNPWAVETQKLQADIDRVRQQVGKTLEGGVLRKEDEEKYKKILATISDVPAVADHKVRSILTGMQAGLKNYKNLVNAGKINPDGSILSTTGPPDLSGVSNLDIARRAKDGDEEAIAEARRRGLL